MKAIYLCGFMGCGKSTVGKLLAARLGMSFTDMDTYIEQQQCMTIPQIFEKYGEEHFRQLETNVIRELGEKGGIIACGGGAMLKEINAQTAAELGTVIYIDTPFDICYDRVSGDNNRPIAAANTKESLNELYSKRKPVYQAHSSAAVDGTGSPTEIAGRISAITDQSV